MADEKKFLRVGVTGGLGGGKTVFCDVWKKAGAALYHADIEAKRLLQEDVVLRDGVREAFGAECYDEVGKLRVSHLAARVFQDDEKLNTLNRMVHPRVLSGFLAFAEEARAQGVTAAVIEAALLFEAGYQAHLDLVVVVHAPEALRVSRAVEQGRFSEADARARIKQQLSDNAFSQRGDYHIDNSGDIRQLVKRAEALWNKITR